MPNQSDRAAGPVAMGPWELGRNDSFVLSAVQALSRAIDRSVQAITMLVGDDTEGLRFRFWTTDHPIDLAIVAEDSANAFGSLTALLLADEDQYLHEEILVGPPPPDIDRWAGRLLYLTPPLAAAMPHLIPPTPITDSPDPDLTMTALDRENLHTLRAHQASLGHITPDMHAVALRTGEQELRLRVFAADPTGDTTTTHTTARIADRLARLLPSGHAPIVTELVPGLPPTDNRLRTLGRMIYWGKDLSPASRRIELLLDLRRTAGREQARHPEPRRRPVSRPARCLMGANTLAAIGARRRSPRVDASPGRTPHRQRGCGSTAPRSGRCHSLACPAPRLAY